MPFASHHLRVAFEGQGDHGFFAWTYSTHDPLETVLAEGYFRTTGDYLRRGDLIFVGISPRPARSPSALPSGEMRRLLLMVTGHRGSEVTVRLVQDFGGPDDPPTSLREPPGRRGRPRKKSADAPSR